MIHIQIIQPVRLQLKPQQRMQLCLRQRLLQQFGTGRGRLLQAKLFMITQVFSRLNAWQQTAAH
jgi:hypothetical protein